MISASYISQKEKESGSRPIYLYILYIIFLLKEHTGSCLEGGKNHSSHDEKNSQQIKQPLGGQTHTHTQITNNSPSDGRILSITDSHLSALLHAIIYTTTPTPCTHGTPHFPPAPAAPPQPPSQPRVHQCPRQSSCELFANSVGKLNLNLPSSGRNNPTAIQEVRGMNIHYT